MSHSIDDKEKKGCYFKLGGKFCIKLKSHHMKLLLFNIFANVSPF